ncbi:MAG TPA: DNA replication and repair protein RecF, partial [Nevskia sp.]|nr:DNA replication and repair protein RecF [Nevskia sp.]
MLITRLEARDFRLFGELALDAHPQFNLVIGDNGAGKTSLLESLHVLGRGASWRVLPSQLVRDGAHAWQVRGRVDEGTGAPAELLRVTWKDRETSIELGQAALGLSELVRRVPLQILDPGMHRMLEEGPGIRRRFLDWGVFHVEHSFMPVWRRTRRALSQRNAVLREGGAAQLLAPWDRELAESAEQLSALRCAHAAEVETRSQRLLQRLLPGESWQLRYAQGWDAERPYLEVLEANLERDRRHGLTSSGPQRAELGFYTSHAGEDGHGPKAVKGRISRGQQKLLVAAFVLAQCWIVAERGGQLPVLLLDDFSAELSAEFQVRLLALLL